MIQLRPLTATLPELEAERWAAFAGEDAAARLLTRALVLAHAESIANPMVIASLWNAEQTELRGVAVALVEVHPGDRPVLVSMVPGAHHRAHCPGLWITEGEDAAQVSHALVAALLEHARSAGIRRVVLSLCPPDQPVLAATAAALGGRAFDAPVDHQLVLPAGTTLDAHLARLPRKRATDLRRDLRRAAEVGARIVDDLEVTTATLERLWPLMAQALARKQPRLQLRGNLFTALASAAPRGSLVASLCLKDETLLGFLLCLRSGATTQFNYLAHVDDPPLHVAAALWAAALEREIARGASLLLLGMTGETLKQRLGATPVAQVHYYFHVL
jgi:predicted N-acyltransferase